MPATNFETALKQEAKRVVRSWHEYTTATRPAWRGSRRPPSGFFMYTHPLVDGVFFRSRGEAARAALIAETAAEKSAPAARHQMGFNF